MELRGPQVSRQDRVGWEAQAIAARVAGQMNVLAWQLVEMLVEVIDAEAWGPGGGLRSPEHWGRAIGPPRYGPVAPPQYGAEPAFTPPTGEPLNTRWFGWN